MKYDEPNNVNSLSLYSLAEIITALRQDGFEVLPESSQQVTGLYFCLDNIFDDTLVFSAEQAVNLSSHRLVSEGLLVIQVSHWWGRLIVCLQLTKQLSGVMQKLTS